MTKTLELATLIGDVVASKQHRSRTQLQRSLESVLRIANEHLTPIQPLETTVGDEFQGGFADIASATRASLLVRLHLLTAEDAADSRYGLGHGVITVFDGTRAPASQDGPGWWAARAAIDRAKALASTPRTSYVRTAFGYWADDAKRSDDDAAPVDAFLICRDATVGRMNERQLRLLLGLLLRRPQAELAAKEGITQGAVSQNLRRSGAFEIAAAHQRLEER